jgi:hypothetical protein
MTTSKIPNPAKEFGCEPFIIYDNSRVKSLKQKFDGQYLQGETGGFNSIQTKEQTEKSADSKNKILIKF